MHPHSQSLLPLWICGLLLLSLSARSTRAQLNPVAAFGCGYGQSYGGLGISAQVHPIPQIAFHAGIGYFPASGVFPEYDFVKDAIMFEAGLRLYAPIEMDPFYPYADFVFGGLGVEATEEYYWDIWGYDYYKQDSQVLIGPSILLGGEIRFELMENLAGGFLAGFGVSYITNDIDWLEQNVMFTVDLGLSLYLLR